jgi:uncharacterized protein YejL (UPF0352 family)
LTSFSKLARVVDVRRILTAANDPQVHDLTADLLGLVAEHDAPPEVALTALALAARRIGREQLTKAEREQAFDEVARLLD